MRKILLPGAVRGTQETVDLAIAIQHCYRYQLRYLSPDQFEVELSGLHGVGPRPLVWADQGTVSLTKPPPSNRLTDFLERRKAPRLRRIDFCIAPWAEILRSGDLIEIGHFQGHRWIQLNRRGRLELRCGDIQGAELPEFELINAFDEDGSAHIKTPRTIKMKPGQTAMVEGYRLYLHRLGGAAFGICNVTNGWIARDTYSADWVMATFERVGETHCESE